MTGTAPGKVVFEVGPTEEGEFEEIWWDDELLDGPPDPVLEWPEEGEE